MDYRNTFRRMHPFTRMLMLALIMFVSLIVVMALGLFAAIPFFEIDIWSYLGGGEPAPADLRFIRYLQAVSHVGLFIIPSVFFAIVVSHRPLHFMHAARRPAFWTVVICVMIMLAALPAVNYLNQLNQKMVLPDALKSIEIWMRSAEDTAAEMVKKILVMHSWQDILFNLFLIAVLPAIGEEFIFRGILQKQFTQWTKNRHLAVIITAILFSAMHLQFFSFLPRLWLGIVLGYMLVYSGNIWYPVLAHFFNNAAALFVFYYYGMDELSTSLENLGTGPYALTLAVSSLVVIIALFVAFRRAGKKKRLRD